MNSRFVLPVIVATAFHALVFLLGNGTHAPKPPVGPTSPPAKSEKPVITIIERSEDNDPAEVPSASSKAGTPEKPDYRPPTDDPPQAPDIFTQEPTRHIDVANETPNFTPTIPKNWEHSVGPGDGPGAIPSSMLDNEPRDRARVAPVYPDEARRQGLTGEVLVEFVVDTTGHVTHAHIIRSSNPLFDGPTLRAVERWRFEAGRRNGQLVPFRMSVPVVFGLDNT